MICAISQCESVMVMSKNLFVSDVAFTQSQSLSVKESLHFGEDHKVKHLGKV